MASSRQTLQALSAQLVHAREEERCRIARELHDELGQRLAALKMDLSSLVPNLTRRAQDGRIIALIKMVDETVECVRRMATELRPLMLDELGLAAAVETLVSESDRRMGIKMTLDMEDGVDAVSEPVAIAAYRIVQEALTNVFRHANASQVKVELHVSDQSLFVNVQDNGKGFSVQAIGKEGAHGLMGMRERAVMLGGHMSIDVGDLGGGRVAVCLPRSSPASVFAAELAQQRDEAGAHALNTKEVPHD
jgi:two-component system sensor histidine kinase UhpB